MNISDNLFSDPALISGIGSVLDVGATLETLGADLGLDDADALRADWIVVGQNLQASISSYEQEQK